MLVAEVLIQSPSPRSGEDVFHPPAQSVQFTAEFLKSVPFLQLQRLESSFTAQLVELATPTGFTRSLPLPTNL